MSGKQGEFKRWLLITAGIASLSTGLIGIIIPVLPTTPFLLLAAICFTHSSPRLHTAILSLRYIGPFIRNYLEERGMSRPAKIWTLCMLWVTLGCSATFATESLIVRIILLVLLIGITTHIILIKTIRKKQTRIQLQADRTQYKGLPLINEDQEKLN